MLFAGSFPSTECPACHKYINTAISTDGSSVRPNDIAMCNFCGNILVFDQQMNLRVITESEVLNLPRWFSRKLVSFRAQIMAIEHPAKLDINDTCPVCEYSLNLAIATVYFEAVKPGNPGICGKCGSFLVFDNDLKLRVMTEDEVVELPDQIRIEMMQARRECDKH